MNNLNLVSQDTNQIISLVDSYFDALYYCDITKIKTIFHPDARYINTNNNDYMNYPLDQYITILSNRQPPAQSNETRQEKLLSIEFNGHSMAHVTLTMKMIKREYYDFLTLIKQQNQWFIICKAFSFIPSS